MGAREYGRERDVASRSLALKGHTRSMISTATLFLMSLALS